jgi:annexin A13
MTINLFPPNVLKQDLTPDAFGQDMDDRCAEITAATKGWGANTDKVIASLAATTAEQRFGLAKRYAELNEGKSLEDLIKSEFRGDIGKALRFLAMSPEEAECCMLKKATDGVGAHAKVLWSILCGRTNVEMELLKKTYFRLYTKDLGKLLASELHGDMERLIFTCLQAGEEEYDPQFHTMEKAVEDAETIHKKGQGSWGTEERGIFKILCAAPPKYVEQINTVYSDKYGYTLMKAMDKELGGNVGEACAFLLGMKLKPYVTIAELVKSACAGFGTDELLLTCTIIRYQYVMQPVMSAHIELYSKTIHDRVRSECGGKYRDALLEVLTTAWPEE